MAANVGKIRKGSIVSEYEGVPQQDAPGSDRQIAEVDEDREHDGEQDKKEAMSVGNLDASDKVDFEKNEEVKAEGAGSKADEGV